MTKPQRIVNLGSTAGEVGDYGLVVYSAMKGAVHAFTKVLAREVCGDNASINAVVLSVAVTFPGADPITAAATCARKLLHS